MKCIDVGDERYPLRTLEEISAAKAALRAAGLASAPVKQTMLYGLPPDLTGSVLDAAPPRFRIMRAVTGEFGQLAEDRAHWGDCVEEFDDAATEAAARAVMDGALACEPDIVRHGNTIYALRDGVVVGTLHYWIEMR